MTRPRVLVVGLGPGDASLLTAHTSALLATDGPVRLRTSVHPAAPAGVASYDHLYESLASFADLYPAIVADLVALAREHGEVVYAVPGSPVVAEHTVELLRAVADVDVVVHPAVSVIDVACVALGLDPMSAALRVVDALSPGQLEAAGGPALVLQAYAPEVLALVADRLPADTAVTVLHHTGLPDARLVRLTAGTLTSFSEADHLTSLYVEDFARAPRAVGDLEVLMTTLRRECPWDQEQTHASLGRHLLEEAYEALDAVDAYADAMTRDVDEDELARLAADVEEELGDLLFQIVFHAQLGREDERFSLTSLATGVHDKLVFRHPHVFGDVTAATSDDVAANWEQLKKAEKQRESVTDGIATQLPALTLLAKLRRKATAVGLEPPAGRDQRDRAVTALLKLVVPDAPASDASSAATDEHWAALLVALGDLAQWCGVDAEALLRWQALDFRARIRATEGLR